MNDDKLADFLLFARKYQKKFEQIANATDQEYAPGDIQNEAWLLIEVRESGKAPINLHNPHDIDGLFAYLYVKLVKQSEKNIRYSARLDYYSYSDSGEGAHPLMNKLAALESSQPLEALLAVEAAVDLPQEPEPHESRAAAYVCLLQHYNNQMKDVADYLLISLSYCYFRVREARRMVNAQLVLPDTTDKPSKAFFPGPWRSFRLPRIERSFWMCQQWVQIELDLMHQP